MPLMKAVFSDGTEKTITFHSDRAFAWRLVYLDTNEVAEGVCSTGLAAERRSAAAVECATRNWRKVKHEVVMMNEVKR